MSKSDPAILTPKAEHAEVENTEETKLPLGNSGLLEETSVLSPEERSAEKKFLLKVDCIVLPLLCLMYFLASLVCVVHFSDGHL